MKDYIKWAVVGIALGAGAYGLVKAGKYLYTEYLKETIESQEFDQVMDDLRTDFEPAEKVSWVTK